MSLDKSTHYHPGEVRLQIQTGRRERLEKTSQVIMRDHMPDQHREFFENLPYFFLGTVDRAGKPWASVLTGPVGFVNTPDAQTMRINATLLDTDPAFRNLKLGSRIGVLGLDFSNRRRNRMHGRIERLDATGVDIRVTQSYGNCPKYINTRVLGDTPQSQETVVSEEREAMNDSDRDLVSRSDTLFIASHFDDGTDAVYNGSDVSHRGGQPGFVAIEDGNTLVIPDYLGNYFFNTFGNLALNPSVGLLFLDFDTGNTLQLGGQAEIVETEAEVSEHPAAQRLLRIRVTSVRATAGRVAADWRFEELSPHSPDLGNG